MTRRRWIAEHWMKPRRSSPARRPSTWRVSFALSPASRPTLFAGGHVFHAEVAAVSLEEIRFNLIAEVQADPALPVTLVVSRV